MTYINFYLAFMVTVHVPTLEEGTTSFKPVQVDLFTVESLELQGFKFKPYGDDRMVSWDYCYSMADDSRAFEKGLRQKQVLEETFQIEL